MFDSQSSLLSRNYYGYGSLSAGRAIDLDRCGESAQKHLGREFARPLEVIARLSTGPQADGMTPGRVAWFNRVCFEAFRYVGKVNNWGPVETWRRVSAGLEAAGMSIDDRCDVERFCMGWKQFSQEQMERYRYRYPTCCPLVDALHPLAPGHRELQELREWITELKKRRQDRDPSVLPVATRGGFRPCGVPENAAQIPQSVQTNQK